MNILIGDLKEKNWMEILSRVVMIFYSIQLFRLFVDYNIRKVIAMQLYDKSLVLKNKSLMIVFGSGGHTSEMLMMIDSFPNIF